MKLIYHDYQLIPSYPALINTPNCRLIIEMQPM